MQLKHLLITVISFTSLSTSAQIGKGSIYLGGYLSFNTNKYKTQTSSSFAISPALGLAVKENLILGVDLSYGYSETKVDNPYFKSQQRTVGAGVFLRQYAPLGKSFYLFGQGRAGAARISTDYEGANSGDDAKGFSIDLGIYPGVAYNVNKRLQLEVGLPNVLSIYYQKTKITPVGRPEYKSTSFGASTSVSTNTSFLSVGVRLFFQKDRS